MDLGLSDKDSHQCKAYAPAFGLPANGGLGPWINLGGADNQLVAPPTLSGHQQPLLGAQMIRRTQLA